MHWADHIRAQPHSATACRWWCPDNIFAVLSGGLSCSGAWCVPDITPSKCQKGASMASIHRYIPVHTSTYQYILVHCIYQRNATRTGCQALAAVSTTSARGPCAGPPTTPISQWQAKSSVHQVCKVCIWHTWCTLCDDEVVYKCILCADLKLVNPHFMQTMSTLDACTTIADYEHTWSWIAPAFVQKICTPSCVC